MKDFIVNEIKNETAVLVGLITPEQNEEKVNEYLNELAFLAETAGLAPGGKRFVQRMDIPNSTTFVGKGKLLEIEDYVKDKENEVGVVIFDDELSARQLRNIEGGSFRYALWIVQALFLIFSRCVQRQPTPKHRLSWHNTSTCFPGSPECGLTLRGRGEAGGDHYARAG